MRLGPVGAISRPVHKCFGRTHHRFRVSENVQIMMMKESKAERCGRGELRNRIQISGTSRMHTDEHAVLSAGVVDVKQIPKTFLHGTLYEEYKFRVVFCFALFAIVIVAFVFGFRSAFLVHVPHCTGMHTMA